MPHQKIPVLKAEAGARDVIVWVRAVTKWIGPGFHPDTPADDYIDPDGRALLSAREASRLDRDMACAFRVLDGSGRSPYDVAIKVQRRLLTAGAR